MVQVGSMEALEKYLELEKENKRFLRENHEYYEEILKLRTQWSDLAGKVNTLFNWLESREDTKTKTIQRKFAETFKFAYMEACFADMIAKWPNKESREYALASLNRKETERKQP
jgi:hypothetical protein